MTLIQKDAFLVAVDEVEREVRKQMGDPSASLAVANILIGLNAARRLVTSGKFDAKEDI